MFLSDTVFVVYVSVLLQSDFSSYIISLVFLSSSSKSVRLVYSWYLPQLGLRVRLLILYLACLLLLFVAFVLVICLVYSYCKLLASVIKVTYYYYLPDTDPWEYKKLIDNSIKEEKGHWKLPEPILQYFKAFTLSSQGAGLPKYKFRSTHTTEKVWYLNMVEKDLLINVR